MPNFPKHINIMSFSLTMPSDQQTMYDHASKLVALLSSNRPEEKVSEIGEIVVRGLSPPSPPFSDNI
jgi:hypothetical protein